MAMEMEYRTAIKTENEVSLWREYGIENTTAYSLAVTGILYFCKKKKKNLNSYKVCHVS